MLKMKVSIFNLFCFQLLFVLLNMPKKILSDADNQFDLNNFYQSTVSLANQFNAYNDDEEIINLRNIINSHVKNYKESNTTPNLNNLDGKTKKLIHKIQKELNEAKKSSIMKGMANYQYSQYKIKENDGADILTCTFCVFDTYYYRKEI
ncbi:Plasmodium exported protein, unknown function [Plasmodium vinckei vinckei]|uniref:Fam-b protein n=1 Tax=Plasmodium vinckei vinckei TaxID=54757 RepID=A0A449BPK0_PLAVN|nr:Plasmodium exported protein, unknown function [Plasmodium vinckei vinckei]VEV55374.1 Plasmodium exported protein, unknown function [Plasmodium vinckei vinckei]